MKGGEMISEKQLDELRKRWEIMPGTVSMAKGLEMVETLEKLFAVKEAAEKAHEDIHGEFCSSMHWPTCKLLAEALAPFRETEEKIKPKNIHSCSTVDISDGPCEECE
jgi:hypothetical protein